MTHNLPRPNKALFAQAIFYVFRLSTVQDTARHLRLPVHVADRLFTGLVPGNSESLLTWIEADPRRSEAWTAIADASTAQPAPAVP
jgi:hypothetical protein